MYIVHVIKYYGNTCYQITGIDEYERKRVLTIVKEKTNMRLVPIKKLETKRGFLKE